MTQLDWKEQLAAIQGIEPSADEPQTDDVEAAHDTLPPRSGRLDVVIDRKARHGKTATIVASVPGSDSQIAALAKELRHRCGTGGSSRADEILLQGDCADRVVAILKEMGYKVRKI